MTVPLLPPYAHVTQEAVQCAAEASLRYDVPELLIHAVIRKENGRIGGSSRNSNGSLDLGPAQINTLWLKHFAKFGLTPEHIRDDFCTNINTSAYILRDYYNKKRDWFNTIVAYNIGPNKWTDARYAIGHKYASEVIAFWWSFQDYVDEQQGVSRPSTGQSRGAIATAKAKASPKVAAIKRTSPAYVFNLSESP